jgi:hypothetical protein
VNVIQKFCLYVVRSTEPLISKSRPLIFQVMNSNSSAHTHISKSSAHTHISKLSAHTHILNSSARTHTRVFTVYTRRRSRGKWWKQVTEYHCDSQNYCRPLKRFPLCNRTTMIVRIAGSKVIRNPCLQTDVCLLIAVVFPRTSQYIQVNSLSCSRAYVLSRGLIACALQRAYFAGRKHRTRCLPIIKPHEEPTPHAWFSCFRRNHS